MKVRNPLVSSDRVALFQRETCIPEWLDVRQVYKLDSIFILNT